MLGVQGEEAALTWGLSRQARLRIHRLSSFHLLAGRLIVLSAAVKPEAAEGGGRMARFYGGRKTINAGLRQMMCFDFQIRSRDAAYLPVDEVGWR